MIKENLEETRINIICTMLGIEKKVNTYIPKHEFLKQ